MERTAAPGGPRPARRGLARVRGGADAGRVRQSAGRTGCHRDLVGCGGRRGRLDRARAELPRHLDRDALRLRRRARHRPARLRPVPLGRPYGSGHPDPHGHRRERLRGRAHRPVRLLRGQRAALPDHVLAARFARPGHLAQGAGRAALRGGGPGRRPAVRPQAGPARARRAPGPASGRGRGAAADRSRPGGRAADGGRGRGGRGHHVRRAARAASAADGCRARAPVPGARERARRGRRAGRGRSRGQDRRRARRAPLGVLTALIGSPFFFWLLRRTRRGQGGWA